jgi:hypothetical protein
MTSFKNPLLTLLKKLILEVTLSEDDGKITSQVRVVRFKVTLRPQFKNQYNQGGNM